MNKMKRTFALVAAAAGITLAAGSAQAVSSVDFVWLNSGTPTVTSPAASSTITGALVLTGDAPGAWLIVFTMQYDTAELDFVQGTELTTQIGPPMQANSIGPITPGVQVDTIAGTVNWDFQGQFTNLTGCTAGCVITLGTVKFHVSNAGGNSTDRDIRLGEFSVGLDGTFAGDGSDIPMNYGSGAVTGAVPEPTTALLVVGGLLGLGYAGRRSAR